MKWEVIGNHKSIRSDLRNWLNKGDSSGFQGSMLYLMKDFRHAYLTERRKSWAPHLFFNDEGQEATTGRPVRPDGWFRGHLSEANSW